MKIQEIKYKSKGQAYSVIIGQKVLKHLPNRIEKLCPKTKNIAIFIDSNVPKKFKNIFKDKLKKFNLIFFQFKANEKTKSMKTVEKYLLKLLSKNFNRSDLIIAVGGGVTGDVIGFISSLYKRGINFINIPTTLLAQADAAIGGKTGVNSSFGKNLIGSFYQPKLVLSDISFLKSLPKKEIVCGYAEILKHSIIKDKKLFFWLKKNSKKIFSKESFSLNYAVSKSCRIKMFFVQKDVHEKNLRMILNFGHTFAHAIEVKHNYSKNITHGEAVLSGMILAIKLSIKKNFCSKKVLKEVYNLYKENNLNYNIERISSTKSVTDLLPYLKNDKKNVDEKINFLLLKKIGKTAKPNSCKISINELKGFCKTMIQ